MYNDFHEIWQQFTNKECLKECWHPFEFQINKALNFAVMCRAPKHKAYSTSMSLTNRVLLTAGIHNLGYHQFWVQVFGDLSMEMGGSLEECLHARDKVKERKRQYKQTRRVKRQRSMKKTMQIVEYVRQSVEEKEKKGMTYSPGMALQCDNGMDDNDDNKVRTKTKVGAGAMVKEQGKTTINRKTLTSTARMRRKCRFCGEFGHSRCSSRHCKQHFVVVEKRNARRQQGIVSTRAAPVDGTDNFCALPTCLPVAMQTEPDTDGFTMDVKASRAQHEDEPPKMQAHVPREFCENGNAVSVKKSTVGSCRVSTFEHLGDVELMDTLTTSDAK